MREEGKCPKSEYKDDRHVWTNSPDIFYTFCASSCYNCGLVRVGKRVPKHGGMGSRTVWHYISGAEFE